METKNLQAAFSIVVVRISPCVPAYVVTHVPSAETLLACFGFLSCSPSCGPGVRLGAFRHQAKVHHDRTPLDRLALRMPAVRYLEGEGT